MYIDGWIITALLVFFVVAAAAIYRWLMHVCSKLRDCGYDHKQAASQEGRL